MDIETRQILGQIIDYQRMTNSKLDILIKTLNDLTNTIIKYDNSYNEEMLKTQGVED